MNFPFYKLSVSSIAFGELLPIKKRRELLWIRKVLNSNKGNCSFKKLYVRAFFFRAMVLRVIVHSSNLFSRILPRNPFKSCVKQIPLKKLRCTQYASVISRFFFDFQLMYPDSWLHYFMCQWFFNVLKHQLIHNNDLSNAGECDGFKCTNGQCISPSDKKCDGIDDCDDNSDETVCK